MIYPWQQSVWEIVQAAKHQQHLPHALLFTGENGCGNLAFVQALAKSLLCLTPHSDGSACAQCRSCQVFIAQAHPDFTSVMLQEERQSILIEQIRELKHFLTLSRSYSPRRLVIISPAEKMNINAANSLLKSLEEPAPDTHLLLLSANPASLLPTIRSRCQEMRLPVPQRQMALTWLTQQPLQHAPEMLLNTARGRPLAALLLDSSETLAHHQEWLQHINQCVQGQGNITQISSHWEKFDKTQLLDWQLDWVHHLLRYQYLSDDLNKELRFIYEQINSNTLWHIQEKLLELKQLVAHPLNPRLFVENMLILWWAKH